jgi:HK97 family phage major capsid protein
MATLASSAFSLPNHLASGLWSKVQTGSTVARLSGQEPMMFGVTQYMTFTGKPKGEVVAEGANKSQSQPTFGTKTSLPRKVQVTMRFNEEVQWADEDYQIGVLSAVRDAGSEALARALDLIVYHGINPLTGVALSGSPAKVLDTTNTVEIVTATLTKPDVDIESAVGLVLADGYSPNGIALDPTFAYTLATERNATTGQKIYPELGTGQGMTNFSGLNAAVSTTVSAPEATIGGGAYASTNPNVKAILGDFSAIRWGVQRQIPVEVIRFGDPDGSGDLKRANQIAIRLEVVYGFALMDTDAFAVVKDAAANT